MIHSQIISQTIVVNLLVNNFVVKICGAAFVCLSEAFLVELIAKILSNDVVLLYAQKEFW